MYCRYELKCRTSTDFRKNQFKQLFLVVTRTVFNAFAYSVGTKDLSTLLNRKYFQVAKTGNRIIVICMQCTKAAGIDSASSLLWNYRVSSCRTNYCLL